jgi:hypothetical protein
VLRVQCVVHPGIAFKNKEKSIAQIYRPLVRILEMPNATEDDVRKFKWDVESLKGKEWDSLVAASEDLPNDTD